MGGRGGAGHSRRDNNGTPATGPVQPPAADPPAADTAADTPPPPPAEPTPQAATTPAPQPVSGAPSDRPILANGWDEGDTSTGIHYHEDGPVGTAVHAMGADAAMDVDGEPLANVMGHLATDAVMGRATPQETLDKFKGLADRLPPDSAARDQVAGVVRAMDGPDTPTPPVPAGVPKPMRHLVERLHDIPIVRAQPDRELAPLVQLCQQFAAGHNRGVFALLREVESLANRRHESLGDSGKFAIDRAVREASDALRAMPRSQLRPPPPA